MLYVNVCLAKWTASERGTEAASTCETTFDCYGLTVPDVPGRIILCWLVSQGVFCVLGWEWAHPTFKKTRFNTPCYQGGNWLTRAQLETGH